MRPRPREIAPLVLMLAACREPAAPTTRPQTIALDAPVVCAAATSEASALRCWVEFFAGPELAGRDNGSPGGERARAAIVAAVRAWGLQPAGETGTFEQVLPRGANVLARVPGVDPARAGEHVVLAAHYDHLGELGGVVYPGADDNASGVAVMLAVARRLAAAPPARSVLVAAFDAEEPPDYRTAAMGSNYFVAHPTVPREQLVAVVCLDLLGGDLWPGQRTPLYVMGRETFAAPPVPTLAADPRLPVRAMHLRLVEELPTGRQAFSDHGGFTAIEVPALFLSTGRSPHYHRPTDTPDRIQYDKLEAAVAVVEAHVRALADADARPTWSKSQPLTAADATALAELLAAGLDAPELAPARPRLAADLARSRALAGAPGALSEADAAALIAASLRVQCLLLPDDEVPPAACP
jgi:hypothetical protein